MRLTSAPKLTATMNESALYQTMGIGLTDNIVLLGHADGLPLNDPYPVVDISETLEAIGSTVDSPLTYGLLDAYLAGARDIWIVPVAPMEEYEPDRSLRDTAYYATYAARLEETYDVLKTWDMGHITVPLEAPFNSTVDFLLPLTNYCVESFVASGDIHLGMLGTTGIIDSATATVMANDPRLGMLREAGKYVSIFAGDISVVPEGLPAHTSSAISVIAGELSRAPLDRSMAYKRLSYAMDIIGPDLDKESINSLAESGINLVGRNIRGRRGQHFEIIPFTDNTLAKEGSDYWSLIQMRLVSYVSETVQAISGIGLGTIGFDLFRDRVRDFLSSLTSENLIRDYELDIDRHPVERTLVLVDINLKPYFGVREIHVPVEVAPEQITGRRWAIDNEEIG